MNMNRYKMACTEILELFKYLPEEDYNKIPKSEIDFFEHNKEENYNFKFNENLSFEEQVILPETEAFIVRIYKNYFCTPEKKLSVDRRLYLNDEKKVSSGDTTINYFPCKNTIQPTQVSSSQSLMQPSKVKWYEKIFKLFKK